MRGAVLLFVCVSVGAASARAQAPVRVAVRAQTGRTLALTPAGARDAPATTCTPPCVLALAPGFYDLGLAPRWRGDGGPEPVPHLDLRTDATVDVQLDDRAGLRAAGWVTLVGAAFAGALAVVGGLAVRDGPGELGGAALAWGGGIACWVAVPVALVLLALGDHLKTTTTRRVP